MATDEQEAIDHLKTCLNDSYNNKIHFFIIEYGNDGNDDMIDIEGCGKVSKSQVMQSLASYFEKERLFKRSSVSMNILVTKCDRIKEGDRTEKVKEYLENSDWASFVNSLNGTSNAAHCGGLNILGFSIGEVFAQDLCEFRPDDAEKITTIIEKHTTGRRLTWWSQLIDFFRN